MHLVNIYKITNTANGKLYFGQTVQSVRQRWNAHVRYALSGKDMYLYRAMRKYGPEFFAIEKVDEAFGRKAGDLLESRYIAEFGTMNSEKGYNMTSGGQGGLHLPENKIKIGEKSKEWWSDPENKKRASESRKGLLVGERNPMFGKGSFTGLSHTEETKQKISEVRKDLFQDPEFKTRMSEANTGKHHTTEGKAHIAEALRGNQYRKGIPHDEETKARIAASMRLAWDRKKSHQAFLDAAVYQTEKSEAANA
jgi:group I intron endonuclease